MNTYTLKVLEIRQETEDTITLCFKQPALKKIKYLAGQYLTLIFRINGRRYLRPYSFSSAPIIDNTLNVTIKRVANGIVSNHIHDLIKVGDSIETMPPMGNFIFNSNTTNVFLWGVGSGITPLISLAKQILAEIPAARINLIYGNRNYESTIFLNEINRLSRDLPDRFIARHFHSKITQSTLSPYIAEGRISYEKVLKVMETTDVRHSLHFICGPHGLKKSVIEGLTKLAVPESEILFEDFELVKDPKEFADIFTRTVNLEFNGNQYQLEVIKGKTILDSALDAGVELPYSCQTGSCNTCIAKVLEGRLKMVGLNLDRKDLLHDEYLLCCSHPLTDDVFVKV